MATAAPALCPPLSPPPVLTDEQLVIQYGNFCGYMARLFVRKNKQLSNEDAEDIASFALLRLIQCPRDHRHEPPYVKRLITNSVIKAYQSTVRVREVEVSLEHFNAPDPGND